MPAVKTQSCKYIINKVYRNLNLDDPNHEYDMIEWIGEAMGFIGAGAQYELKVSTLTVASFKTALPDHLLQIKQVLGRESTDANFELMSYNPKTFPDAYHEDESPNLTAKSLFTYSIVPDYIHTNIETGEIKISYLALLIDDNGYPLVPDNQYYNEAFFWYITKQMIMGGYLPKNTDITFEVAEQRWKFYCSGARNSVTFPDIEGYQRFQEVWTGLIPMQYLNSEKYDMRTRHPYDVPEINAQGIPQNPLTPNI